MNASDDIRDALLALPAVTAIVGSGATARIWSDWQRTYTVPCIIIDIDKEEEQNDLTGKAGGLVVADVTLTCRESTETLREVLRQAVRSGLSGYSGTFDGILDDTQNAAVPKDDGSDGHWYDAVMSFTMLWQEAV